MPQMFYFYGMKLRVLQGLMRGGAQEVRMDGVIRRLPFKMQKSVPPRARTRTAAAA